MKSWYFLLFLFLVIFNVSGCVLEGYASSNDSLKVSRITPGGNEVQDLRQIVVEFDRPMAALGEEKPDGRNVNISINPKVECPWRWLNETSLVCELDEKDALAVATRYEIVVRPGLVSKEGLKLSSFYRHEFTTQLPNIESAYLEDWKSPSRPVIHVWTNQPIEKKDIENSLRIFDRTNQRSISGVKVSAVENGSDREWLVEPAKELPKDAELALQIAFGLKSKLGPEQNKELREVFTFDTFADFAFIGVECSTNQGKTITILDSEKSSIDLCSTQSPVSLLFNSPVSRGEIFRFIHLDPIVAQIEKEAGQEMTFYETYQLKSNHSRTGYYKVELPRLKPFLDYHLSFRATQNQKVPKDLFDRELSSSFSLRFMTDHLLPNLSLPYTHAVLEKAVDSDVVMTVTNLDSWDFQFHGVNATQGIAKQLYHQNAPRYVDKKASVPLKIRERLQNKSGAIFGKFLTDPVIPSDYPREITLFAQVTPYQVHVKIGHFSSLVWVTDLNTGDVVKDARVRIYKDSYAKLSANFKPLSEGKTDTFGVAMLAGTSVLDPKLELMYGYLPDRDMMFVRVDKGEDMALLPLEYDYEVSVWRASNGSVSDYLRQKDSHIVSFGTTAQGVYRLGDKIQFKIYVRAQNNEKLTPPEKKGYKLRVMDALGRPIHENDAFELSQFGAFDGEFMVPKNGSVGWYQFELVKKSDESTIYYPMRVLVSDFTPAPFRVTQDLSGDAFNSGQQVKVRTYAKLHSGGGFQGAAGRVTASIESKYFASTNPLIKDFEFATAKNNERFKEIFQSEVSLDKNGEVESVILLPDSNIYFGDLKVESVIMDDRGKNIATQSQAKFSSVDRLVGMKRKEWDSSTKKPVEIQYVVTDINGELKEGTYVQITLEREKRTISRIKDVGSSYSTHVKTVYEKYSDCSGISSLEFGSCEFKISQSGVYRLTAKIKDTKDKEHETVIELWVSGDEPIVWDEKNGEFLEIEAENKKVAVGDKARFMVKNPYGKSKALITVERYGVIDRFVKTFTSSTEIIEIPVKESYLPGFYVSVIIQSERVSSAKVNGQLDLGKPTFAMGYIDVPVVDRYKEIVVTAKTDNEVYRPREKVRLSLHAAPRIKKASSEPIELAVIVLDESVFDMLSEGNAQFDPYRGLNKFESLDLRNFSLLTRLVGRQKLETKGANPGGGGGVDVAMRSVFKYVSYFNPSVIVNSSGNAVVEFEAPDNLTGWRVLVMAVTPTDKAGLGTANFKVNRPTEIRPLLPNQIVEGDSFNADFSVMNRTSQKRQIRVSVKASGAIQNGETSVEKVLTLQPFERSTVSLSIRAKQLPYDRNISSDAIKFVVRAGDSLDTDGVTHNLTVKKQRSLQTVALYGSTIDSVTTKDILFQKDIYADIGSLDVSLSPTILSSLDGSFRYMRDYPHECLEQKLSKAVVAESYESLKKYLDKQLTWPKSNLLANEVIQSASEFQAPNGGMCYFIAGDFYADPYLSAFTSLAFQWFKLNNKVVPADVEARLDTYLDNFLRREVSPDYYSDTMTASVRATALLSLSLKGKTVLEDLARYEPYFEKMSLMGKAHFLEAALNTKGASVLANNLLKKLLSKKTELAGKVLFSETKDDNSARILSTPVRNNCAALSALVSAAKKNGTNDLADISLKLVRSINETRKSRDYFENTQENMFCLRALADYSKTFESEKPQVKVQVKLDEESLGKGRFESQTSPSILMSRAIKTVDPGKKAKLLIEREGGGRVYYSALLNTSSRKKDGESKNAGIDVKREYSVLKDKKWIVLKSPIQVKRGDTVRVDLFVSMPANGNFVVVNDPIPGGLEAVNVDLATGSMVDANGTQAVREGSAFAKLEGYRGYGQSYYGFYHKELHKDSARYYSDFLPKGKYHLSYVTQAIAEGVFSSPGPKAEEMYNPDVFGVDKSETITIGSRNLSQAN